MCVCMCVCVYRRRRLVPTDALHDRQPRLDLRRRPTVAAFTR